MAVNKTNRTDQFHYFKIAVAINLVVTDHMTEGVATYLYKW